MMRPTPACRAPLLVAALLVGAGSGRAAPPAPRPPSRVHVVALPAGVSLVAVVPVPSRAGRDLFDLDLRVEVVLPFGCGDQVAGLLKRSGPHLDDADAYDTVLERRSVGECHKDPTRVGARTAIRMRLPDGAARELVIGERRLRVARAGDHVTLDGQPPTGDVPGAPPTAAPTALVVGEVSSARVTSAARVPGTDAVEADLELTARLPRCATTVLGLLGRGDLASRFRLDRFAPLARAPLDGSCARELVARKVTTSVTVRTPWDPKARVWAPAIMITVGASPLEVRAAPGVPPPRAAAAGAAAPSPPRAATPAEARSADPERSATPAPAGPSSRVAAPGDPTGRAPAR